MTDLTDKEAQTLFNAASSAIRENDVEKLAALADTPEVTDDTGTPKVEDTPDPLTITPDDDNKDNTDTPDPLTTADQTDEKEKKDDDQKVPTELEKLQAQLAAVSKENHALKSQAGRVPHIQSRLKDLDRRLEELQKVSTSPSSQPSTKITPKVEAILAGIKETDPELAKAVLAAIATASDEVAIDGTSRELAATKAAHAEATQEYQQAEAQRLVEMYPNAKEVFVSPSWAEWKSKQSRAVQSLAGSDSADDVAFAFDKYAQDMLKAHPELATKGTTPVVDDTAAKLAAEKAKQVETQRQRQKETAANVGSPAGAGKVELPDDAIALFNKFSADIRKERTG